jgi:hypothetical protein
MTSLLPSIFEAFAAQIQRIRARLTDPDSDIAFLATSYFDTLASKSGNDILEGVLVRATGRTLKAVYQKHGADSADGELEAKPMKCGYSAHISDDTPASLLRHQQIPWIILGEASPDGTEIKWACLASYRIFDDERFRAFTDTPLPADPAERYASLLAVKRAWPTKQYIRSNPLSYKTLLGLQPGQYSFWINPDAPNTDEIRVMAAKATQISAETIATTLKIRDHFAAVVDYTDMTYTRLRELSKEKGIKGVTKKTKEELIQFLSA